MHVSASNNFVQLCTILQCVKKLLLGGCGGLKKAADSLQGPTPCPQVGYSHETGHPQTATRGENKSGKPKREGKGEMWE